MFKKLFRQLTQSDAQRYQQKLEEFAASLEKEGAPQLGTLSRQFAKLKNDIDQRRGSGGILSQVENVEQLIVAVSDGVCDALGSLSKLNRELPSVVTTGDSSHFENHMRQWREGHATLLRAHAALKYVATGETTMGMDEPAASGKKSALDEAIEALQLEIRTAERIKHELGG